MFDTLSYLCNKTVSPNPLTALFGVIPQETSIASYHTAGGITQKYCKVWHPFLPHYEHEFPSLSNKILCTLKINKKYLNNNNILIQVKMILLSQTVYTGLDHHQKEAVFATCGQQVDIWDEQRSSPIRSFTWGVDSFSSVRFNPVEVRDCASHHTQASLVMSQSEELSDHNRFSVFKHGCI